MTTTAPRLPLIQRQEVIGESVAVSNVLGSKNTKKLDPIVNPDVTNFEFIECSGAILTITEFRGGQEGQVLSILGDGLTSIANVPGKIFNNIGAAKVLEPNLIYRFTKFNDTWYEDCDVISPGGLGPIPPHTHDWTDILNTPTTLAGYGITDAYTKAQADSLFAPTVHTHSAASITTGTFGVGDYIFPNNLTVTGPSLNVRGQNYTWPNAQAAGALTNDGLGNLTWVATASGVTSVTGTANRIFVNPNVGAVIVDISATYAGQASITTVGTITSGVWNGTAIASAYLGPHFHNAADINAGSFQNSPYTFPNNLTVSGTLFPTELVITKSVNNASGMALIQTTAATPSPRLFFQNTPDAFGNAIYQLAGGTFVITTGATYTTASGTARFSISPTGNITIANSLTIGTGLTVTAGGANVTGVFILSGPSGGASARDFRFATAGSNRWVIRTDSVAESGANVGSDFQLMARDDTGAAIDTPIAITRALGGTIVFTRPLTITAGNLLTANGGATLNGTVTVNSPLTIVASAGADLRFKETSQVLPLGLWSVIVSSDNLFIRKNTAAAGDFSTQIIALRFSATGQIVGGTWNSTIIGLTYGGTGSNLSATGPGFLKQSSLGANVTVSTLVSGDLPTHTHAASDITAGTFGVGNYVFPAALTITTTLTINGLTYTFPATHGVNGAVLTNNSSGVLTWTLPGSAPVTSVTGTANRITVSPTTGVVVVDIAATYVGQASITTLGTITVGTWNGSVIASAFIGAHGLVSATHTVSGLTTGNYLRANSATTYGFAQVQYSELGGVPATFPPAAHTHPASEITAGTFGAGTFTFQNQLNVNGLLNTGNDIYLSATRGFFLDGGGNTYIYESAADVVRVVAGGVISMTITSSQSSVPGSFVLASGQLLYLDGGVDTFIYEAAANYVRIVTGGVVRMEITTGQVYSAMPLIVNDYLQIPSGKRFYIDGGFDTYITETSADLMSFVTNGVIRMQIDGSSGIFVDQRGATNIFNIQKDAYGEILRLRVGDGTFNPGLFLSVISPATVVLNATGSSGAFTMILQQGNNDKIRILGAYVETVGPVRFNSLTYTFPASHVTNGFLKNDGAGNLTWVTVASSVTGTGTTNTIPLWSSSTTLADSILQQSSANVLQITTSGSPAALRFFDNLGYIEISKTTTGTLILTNSLTTVTAAMIFSSVTPQFVFRASVTNVSDLGTSSLRWRNVYGTAALVSVVELFDPLGITSLGKITASPFNKLQWDDGVIVKTIAAVVPIAAPADPVDLPSALAVIISLKTHLQNAGVFL